MMRLPRINELVLVRVGEPEFVLRSRVEGRRPGFLSIAHPSDGLTARSLPLATEVTLEWLVKRGLGTVTGTVVAFVEIGVPALSIRLDSEPAVFQRRTHVRSGLVLELDVWPADPDVPTISGVTLDVSGGGLRALLPVALEPGSLVHVSVDMPTGAPVEALARVVNQRDDGEVAFEFDDIVATDRERLIRAVFASYRVAAFLRRAG
jgi:c-di-GMP-binding flagellar brake protein YcgR